MAVKDEDHIIIASAIRNTTPVNSAIADTGEFRAETIVIVNGLDKQVSFQLQGSRDQTVWFNIGDSFLVGATTDDYQTVTDYFPCYRVVATATTAPTSGVLDAWMLKAMGS